MSDQRVAIVTGSSRGIGRGIAERLGRSGYRLVINYLKNAAAAEAAADMIRAAGSDAVTVQADVGRAGGREGLVRAAEDRFGRLDLLVNNAGITSPGRKDLLELSEDGWERVFQTNLQGPFFLAQRAARAMIEHVSREVIPRGTIINISSISAFAVSIDRADYCIAKAGMQMMTWLLATRLAEEQIRVFEICPGVIASDMTAPVREKYDALIAGGLSPIKRWGQPDDVARAVEMLASDTLPFSTGERLHVDGGFHIRRL